MKNMKIENLFLIISLFFGLLLVLIVPPFQSPDENSHFLKAYSLSEGTIRPQNVDGNVGYYSPKNSLDYIDTKLSMMGNRNMKYDYSSLYLDQMLSTSYNSKTFRSNPTSFITPFAYVVPATGIILASNVTAFDYSNTSDSKHVSTSVLLQYARIFSLVVYSVIGFFAIKITPKLKKTFFTILLLPTSLFLRSMVTYDSLIVVITALSVSKMLQLYVDEKHKFNNVDCCLLVVCGYFLLNVKTVYSVVFLLMFFIPYEKFGTKKNQVKQYIKMITLVLILTLLSKICYFGISSETHEILLNQQRWAISHPIYLLKILITNIFEQMHTQLYFMVGTVGLLDTYLPVLMVGLIYFNLIIVSICEALKSKIKFSMPICLLYVIFIFLSVIAVYGYMYIQWSPLASNQIGGTEVSGVQGRYYIPYLFMLPLVLCNKVFDSIYIKFKKIVDKFDNIICEYYWFIPVCSLIITMFVVVSRYYI